MRQRKFSRPRLIRKMILVVCEGPSEAIYVEYLKNLYRLPVAIKTRVPGNKINSRLINQYIRELSISPSDVIETVYLYDADVPEVTDKLRHLPGITILSNPCFEIWLLLHSVDFKKNTSSSDLLKNLLKCDIIWKDYKKGQLSMKQQQYLTERIHIASTRAKKMHWPDNPSTNLHRFIELLDYHKSQS